MNEVSQTPLQLLEQGLDLMLYGMGIVFVFLAVLVTAITLISFIIHKFCSESGAMEALPEQDSSSLKVKEEHMYMSGARLLKILQKAVDQHRNRH